MVKNIKNKATEFIKHGMWEPKSNSPYTNRLIKEIRVFYFTFINSSRHNVKIQSAALTFYTMMAIVPILAMIFGITKGFGVEDIVTSLINDNLAEYESLIKQISEFANAYLARSNVGLFSGISIFVLLWSVVMVFESVESAFNHVWDIKKGRGYSRKVSDYLSILLLTPLVIVLFSSISMKLDNLLIDIYSSSEFMKWITELTIVATKYLGTWFVISILYYVLPNTKVRYIASLRAAMISGTVLLLFSDVYFFFQRSVSSYDAVYGGFAALPLLLVWLNFSWQIILFGAELSFAYQNISKYEYEREVTEISKNFHDKLAVIVMYHIIKNFEEGKPPLTSERIASAANIPLSAVHNIMYDFEKSNLILSIDQDSKSSVYALARNLNNLTIVELFNVLNTVGCNSFGNDVSGSDLVNSYLNEIYSSTLLSEDNIKIIDLKDLSSKDVL